MSTRSAPSLWLNVCFAVSVAGAAGCNSPRMMTVPDAAFHCESNADCDDGAACTDDSCTASGTCSYSPLDALCPAGQHCLVGTGCSDQMVCSTAAMCDDGHDCTTDTCDVGNICGHRAHNELCTTPGMNICDLAMGCIAGSTTTCASTADCDDSVSCTLDSCGVDRMCRHVPMDTMCTGMDEHCDMALGCVVRHGCVTAADCTEFYNFCDGDPTCDPEFGCQSPATPRMCNDGNTCTLDSCDRTAGTRGACSAACDTSMPSCTTTEPLCALGPTTCDGVFDVTGPNLTGSCAAFLGPPMLRWDFTRLTFANTSGLALTVTPRVLTTMGFSALALNDSAAPVCPMFMATATVTGGCNEYYEVSGMFSDDNTVSGTVNIRFTDDDGFSCSAAACSDQTSTFSGTRMP
jgi:hypothetical protein